MIRELEMFFRFLEAEVFFLLDLLLDHWVMTSFKIWMLFFYLKGGNLEAEDLYLLEIHGQHWSSHTLQNFRDISAFGSHYVSFYYHSFQSVTVYFSLLSLICIPHHLQAFRERMLEHVNALQIISDNLGYLFPLLYCLVSLSL